LGNIIRNRVKPICSPTSFGEHNYPWLKGIQRLDPLQRADNHKSIKMGWGHLKIFSRTKGPILTRLGTNHPRGQGIQVCSNEGDCPSPRGDNSKRVKMQRNFF
jgi:hypothetical protein